MLRNSRQLGAIFAAVAAALLLSACGPSTSSSAPHPKPAKLVKIPGSNVAQVILTDDGAKRIDLHTDAIGQQDGGRSMPYAAIIYDSAGAAWAYTVAEPLTFVRQSVSVEAIKDNIALLKDGPPPGTEVVTVGAAELYGVEFGAGH
jgi:hypothetical protein